MSTVVLLVLVVVVVARLLPDVVTLPPEERETLADMRAALAEWRTETPPPHSFATDLEWFRSEEPDAWAEATRLHHSLADDPSSVHELFDWFVTQLTEMSPDWGLALGVHPHPGGLDRCDALSTARQLVLLDDVSRRLRNWPSDRLVTTHDVIDRDAFLEFVESGAAPIRDPDSSTLATVEAWIRPFLALELDRCCPAEDRARAALSRIDELVVRLPEAVAELNDPETDDLQYAVQFLTSVREDFVSYAEDWEVGPELERDLAGGGTRLAAAIDETLEALARFRGRAPQPEHNAARLAAFLRWSIGPDADIADEFERVVDSLERALLEQERYYRLLEDDAIRYAPQEPVGNVRAIAEARETVGRWVPFSAAEDPGLEIRSVPPPLRGIWAGGFYLGTGVLAPLATGTFLVDEPDAADADFERTSQRIHERRIATHEAYPGHHVHHVLSARACRLRRVVSDPSCVEGWATYAEDLVDPAPVDGDAAEAWQRIGRDVDQAAGSAAELAVFGLGVSHERVRRWLAVVSTHGDAEYVARTRYVGQNVSYAIGARQIRELVERARREGAADFSLRAFHRRLLENGPIPVRFHARELLQSDD